MKTILKILLIAALVLAAGKTISAQEFAQNYNFSAAGTNGPAGHSFTNSGINSWFISWQAVDLSNCTIQVDSSADDNTWGNGDVIAAESCTSIGSAYSSGTVSNPYIRVDVTVLVGSGLNVTLKGYGGASPSNVNLSGLAPDQNTIYLSPNCGTQTNCYPVNDDGRMILDASFTSGSGTVTCPNDDCNFTASHANGGAYVGETCYGTINGPGGGHPTGALLMPQGTITSINSAQSVTCSENANTNETAATFVFLTPDDTDLAAADTAYQDSCASVVFPTANASNTGPAIIGVASGHFNTQSTFCSYWQAGDVDGGSNFTGGGVGSTFINALPNFSWSSASCPASALFSDNYVCFFGGVGQGTVRDLSFTGFGNNSAISGCPSSNTYFLAQGFYLNIYDVNLLGFGSTCNDLIGIGSNGQFQTLRRVVDDAFGGESFVCSASYCVWDSVSAQDNDGGSGYPVGASVSSGAYLISLASQYGPQNSTTGTDLLINFGGTYDEHGDCIGGGLNGIQCRGACHMHGGIFVNGTSEVAVRVNTSGAVMTAEGMIAQGGSSGGTGLEIDSGTTFQDLGGNTFGGATPVSLSGSYFGASSQLAQTSAATNFGSTLSTQNITTLAPTGPVTVNLDLIQSTLGVGCGAGTNTVTPTLAWTGPGGTSETLALSALSISADGTLDSNENDSVSITAKAGTTISYTTASTLASTDCSTKPAYTIYTKAVQ